ncbi:hypothetical protein C8C83_0806 [Flavobacterium sp. 90]|uniref:hypothetical protein n=1 Tax=unclassified Flavobacterium TaxID=196869 RepID=UPI000EAFAB8B|nr:MULTISPECIES: hypothetical protein [unclassified Flavobacterium]RKR09189.1 hypothetical protein C8C82_1105 [Flavobacterium sp. 81]TCK52973.1 hypothetical protein C8C83_0806 [Flavobacterium sp. 90]
MKNLLLLFSAFTLVLTSCSNDDNNSSEDTSILPKTITYSYPSPDLGTNTKNTITYDGNKIVSSISVRSKALFTYTGNFITKQQLFDIDSKGLETKDMEAEYTYENGKLKTRITREYFTPQYPNGTYIGKTIYTHVSNNLISYIDYEVDADTQIEKKISEGTFTYKEGNLIEDKNVRGVSTSTRTYEYDTKNNPLKNILGLDLLLKETEISRNNISKIKRVDSDSPDTSVYLSNYIYNDKDFPTKQTSFAGDGKSIEYEIEYTY